MSGKMVQASQPTGTIPVGAAVAVTLAAAVAYTALDYLQPAEPFLFLLAFVPGVAGALFLLGAGLSRAELRLLVAPLSVGGGLALVGTTLLMLPILASSTGFVGWGWLPALVYAPASAVAQEIYFRSSLLSALEHLLRGRRGMALLCHSLFFVGFHLRTFTLLPSLSVGLLVAVVLFAGGCGWGWQVQRDGTILWAVIQHSLFLVVMSMFGWG